MDWTNLVVSGHEVKIHKGFMHQYSAICAKMFEALLKLDQNSFDEIIFTGHSLGGALATIAAVFVKTSKINRLINKPIKLHTFGCPRVGDIGFNSLFTSLFPTQSAEKSFVWRVVNKTDPIPMSPSQTIFFTHHEVNPNYYQHVNSWVLVLNANPSESKVVSQNDNNLSFFGWGLSTSNVWQHKGSAYMDNLAK